MRHLFDVHAAGGRGHDRDAPALAIERQAQVQLALDVRTGLDIDVLDRQPRGPGLLGDQALPEHACRGSAHACHIARQLDAAGLAAATRMHLRLDDPELAAQRLGGGLTASSALAATRPSGTGTP